MGTATGSDVDGDDGRRRWSVQILFPGNARIQSSTIKDSRSSDFGFSQPLLVPATETREQPDFRGQPLRSVSFSDYGDLLLLSLTIIGPV
ncbi:hypothetical protein MRB53_022007 [Persea americana]|uniref:Uncharacterized protein n=1 Tax=Persea americana TaxID=3435 RepID=A0ACC2L5J4_PERAE|nr:hypothetical protein MRB53_022007 [Persea americana]